MFNRFECLTLIDNNFKTYLDIVFKKNYGKNRLHGTQSNQINKGNNKMTDKFFLKKDLNGSSKWRICFYKNNNESNLVALKGLEFDREDAAAVECQLWNLANSINFYFKEIPPFRVGIGSPAKIWETKVRQNVLILMVGKEPLLPLGSGNEALTHAFAFIDKIKKERQTGGFQATVQTLPKPETLFEQFAQAEGLIGESLNNISEAFCYFELIKENLKNNLNMAGVLTLESRLKTIEKELNLWLRGDDLIPDYSTFTNFVLSVGCVFFTDKITDDFNNNEISFINGFEQYLANQATDAEKEFIKRLKDVFKDDSNDDDFRKNELKKISALFAEEELFSNLDTISLNDGMNNLQDNEWVSDEL